jgi:hypothetical protein
MATSLEIMHRMFREQHRQMVEEQKRLLEDYKQYFDGVLVQIEKQEQQQLPKPTEAEAEAEDMEKEIATLGALLDEAVTTYGKELVDIIEKLTEKQRKKTEAGLKEMEEKIS